MALSWPPIIGTARGFRGRMRQEAMHALQVRTMNEKSIHVEAIAEADGEVRFANLPCRRGDRVAAEIRVQTPSDAAERRAARQRVLDLMRRSRFVSRGPYPTRDELHERS